MNAPITFSATGGSATSGGLPARLERAYFELREPPAHGSAAPGPPRGRIDFQFNPTELSLSKKAKWTKDTQPNSRSSGVPHYKGPEPSTLTLEMFLDATATADDRVVRTVDRLFTCCVPTDKTRSKGSGSPPWVVFHWGGLTGFTAYICSVAAKFTLFTPSGTPIRAVCTVTLEEISGETARQNPTSGGRTAREGHRLVAGDTLASIAQQAYGNPAAWREIAEANGIDNPFRLRPGTTLLLPAPEELTSPQISIMDGG
ncbi:LysM peptidoglycan-binding domain-containing protein [Amycolatopsis taiwanensis]|uniref:CIS tube protein n=1 Tax=Amycolatopsis taiwanensis TaxID=342230 RepID=UPI0004877DEF|nr:LysM peptidoglycan-binding domain-containing protein [Amycolatopsis taiwanensis]